MIEKAEEMGQNSYLRMRTGDSDTAKLISSDIKDLTVASKNLVNHSFKLVSSGFGASFLGWIASFAAIYLLILDRTNWKTNILTSLLIPYIFLSLPSVLFNILGGEVGKWISFIAVILRLFFPHRFPDWLELPGAFFILVVVAPSFFASTIRDSWIGLVICLVIACYLLQEHIRAAGGFRDAFTKAHGVSNTIGIIVLFVYPVWALFLYIL